MNNSEEKLSFLDTLPGFALRLFGTLLLADVLSQFFMFFFVFLTPLLGEFLVDFIVGGMGIAVFVTATYQTAWKKGFRDLGLVSRNATTFYPTKGLYAGLLASVPSVIAFLVFLFIPETGDKLFAVIRMIYSLLNSYALIPFGYLFKLGKTGILLSGLFLLPLPLIAWAGYVMGYKNILITKKIMYGENASEQKTDGLSEK